MMDRVGDLFLAYASRISFADSSVNCDHARSSHDLAADSRYPDRARVKRAGA